jgi:hypothetical protein
VTVGDGGRMERLLASRRTYYDLLAPDYGVESVPSGRATTRSRQLGVGQLISVDTTTAVDIAAIAADVRAALRGEL